MKRSASEVRQKHDQVYPLHTMKLPRTWCIQLLQRMALYRTVLNCRCVYMFPIVHDVLNHLNHFFFGRLLMTCLRLYAILFVGLAQSAPLKGSAGKFARQLQLERRKSTACQRLSLLLIYFNTVHANTLVLLVALACAMMCSPSSEWYIYSGYASRGVLSALSLLLVSLFGTALLFLVPGVQCCAPSSEFTNGTGIHLLWSCFSSASYLLFHFFGITLWYHSTIS